MELISTLNLCVKSLVDKKYREPEKGDKLLEMAKSFNGKVYEITRAIPKGKVATYGQIAKLVGKARAARAVGSLMRHNPAAPRIPCHRVVSSDGSLTGYSGPGGLWQKKKMLLTEGVCFKDNKIDLSVSGWGREA